MRFASLGSGSEGNALLVCASSGATATTVMLDCGFSMRETERRLARLGVSASELSAIVVTHEHQDHIGGVFGLARRYGLPLWMSSGTFQAVQGRCEHLQVHFCRDSVPFAIGGLQWTPYTVPHDAREPVQFHVSDGRCKLGILTDAGTLTPHMRQALHGCDGLVLECNHEPEMLDGSPYPVSLKRRIKSEFGHFSNQESAELLASIDCSRLRTVVGAHLSAINNSPELVRNMLREALKEISVDIRIACQQQGVDWVKMGY